MAAEVGPATDEALTIFLGRGSIIYTLPARGSSSTHYNVIMVTQYGKIEVA